MTTIDYNSIPSFSSSPRAHTPKLLTDKVNISLHWSRAHPSHQGWILMPRYFWDDSGGLFFNRKIKYILVYMYRNYIFFIFLMKFSFRNTLG
jgi:hypothetical protein